MEPVTVQKLTKLAEEAGGQIESPLRMFLLGGSAMLLLGSLRATTDVDVDLDTGLGDMAHARFILETLADGLKLDLEFVPLAEFVPLPEGFENRHRHVGWYGNVELLVFDPYSLAMSKIARGFETDIEDVLFMLRQTVIEFSRLRDMYLAVLPRSWDADVDPAEFRQYFGELERRLRDAD